MSTEKGRKNLHSSQSSSRAHRPPPDLPQKSWRFIFYFRTRTSLFFAAARRLTVSEKSLFLLLLQRGELFFFSQNFQLALEFSTGHSLRLLQTFRWTLIVTFCDFTKLSVDYTVFFSNIFSVVFFSFSSFFLSLGFEFFLQLHLRAFGSWMSRMMLSGYVDISLSLSRFLNFFTLSLSCVATFTHTIANIRSKSEIFPQIARCCGQQKSWKFNLTHNINLIKQSNHHGPQRATGSIRWHHVLARRTASGWCFGCKYDFSLIRMCHCWHSWIFHYQSISSASRDNRWISRTKDGFLHRRSRWRVGEGEIWLKFLWFYRDF